MFRFFYSIIASGSLATTLRFGLTDLRPGGTWTGISVGRKQKPRLSSFEKVMGLLSVVLIYSSLRTLDN